MSPPKGPSGTPARSPRRPDQSVARAGQAHRPWYSTALVGLRAGGAEARDPGDRRRAHAGAARGGLATAARRIRLRDRRDPGAVQAPVAPLRCRANVFSHQVEVALRARRRRDRRAGRHDATTAEGHTPKRSRIRVLAGERPCRRHYARSATRNPWGSRTSARSRSPSTPRTAEQFRARVASAPASRCRWTSSDAPYRDIGTPLRAYIRGLTADPDTVVNMVMPEIVVRGSARVLHNQRALYLKRVLLFERHVILSSVPYQLFR